jgi:hypothetical protein
MSTSIGRMEWPKGFGETFSAKGRAARQSRAGTGEGPTFRAPAMANSRSKAQPGCAMGIPGGES